MDFNRKCVKILPLQADSKLKCGVCGEFLVIPPIYSCLSVKYICGPCFEGYRYYLDNDELRAADRPVRQILYENYASRIQFPCSYYPHCRGIMSFNVGAKLHYKEYCFAKVLWIFKCPISKPNRWFLRPNQRHCNVEYKLNRLYDNECSKLMRHIRNYHNEYVLEKPYILDLKSLKNNVRTRQLFVLLIEENDIIAVLMTEITKTDIIFRCRVNDSVDTKSMTADPYECCVTLVPPNERFSSIMDVKFECVQFDSKDVEYPWQSLRLPIRHLIDETIFKICVLPRSLMMRCIPYLHRDRQLYKAIEYNRYPSETTLCSSDSNRTDIELLSFPSSNSENPPIEFGKTASELWGMEEPEDIENTAKVNIEVGFILEENNEITQDVDSPPKNEENQKRNAKRLQEEKKLSASRKLFNDDSTVSNRPSMEDPLSKVILDFSDSSIATPFPGEIQELTPTVPSDQEKNIGDLQTSQNQSSKNTDLDFQQNEILSSETKGISNDQWEKEQDEMKKKASEANSEAALKEGYSIVPCSQNEQNETMISNNDEKYQTKLEIYRNISKSSSIQGDESDTDDLLELIAFVTTTPYKDEDHELVERKTPAEKLEECSSTVEDIFNKFYQQNEISTSNSEDLMKTEEFLQETSDVTNIYQDDVSECSSSGDIMPSLELVQIGSSLPSTLHGFEKREAELNELFAGRNPSSVAINVQECSSSKDIMPSSDSASIEFPSVLQDFELYEQEVGGVSASDNRCSSSEVAISALQSAPKDSCIFSNSTSTQDDLPELIEIVSSTIRDIEPNHEIKDENLSSKAFRDETNCNSRNIVDPNDENRGEKRKEIKSKISSKENIRSPPTMKEQEHFSISSDKNEKEKSLNEEKRQQISNKKDVLTDITHNCLNE